MNRRQAREYALKKLYQYDFSGEGETRIPLDEEAKLYELVDDEFALDLVRGTLRNLTEIDRIIQEAAQNWRVDRMAVVDRNILRCAAYELLYRDDIPPAVTINEALEIAKKFSSLESASFINGLLDKIMQVSRKSP